MKTRGRRMPLLRLGSVPVGLSVGFAMVLALLSLTEGAEKGEPGSPVRICVGADTRHSIDPRMFGQFLERPSWGETGPEAAVDQGGSLPHGIMAMLQAMRIPVVRFPGGTDVDFTDWTAMISNAPGRTPQRPLTQGHQGHVVTNRFGYDEYFRVRDRLGWDTILVVNFLDGLAKRKPLKAAAQHAAGLVAYVNAPVGAKLPEGMPDWPAVRTLNGHPQPHKVRIFQLGNEWWFGRFPEEVKRATGTNNAAALAAWYRECILAYADAMRAVDPSIELIMDGNMGQGIETTLLPDPELRRRIKYVAYHNYAPGQMSKVTRDGKPVPAEALSSRDWWIAWTAMPGSFDDQGRNIAFGDGLARARNLGYEIAVTEWNWMGLMEPQVLAPLGFEWRHAAALGVAGFLNGMIRQGEAIRMANQSMLIGHAWDMAAIRIDPTGAVPPHYNAQGAVTTFYNLHHGGRLLDVSVSGVPTAGQPYSVGWMGPVATVALLDVVATRSDRALFVHAVNRALDVDLAAEIDITALGAPDGPAVLHVLEGVPAGKVPTLHAWMREMSRPVNVATGSVRVVFPRRTASILELPLKETPVPR